jgi:hypothetical protein
LAARIIGTSDAAVQARLDEFRTELRDVAVAKGAALREQLGQ